jgi:hypothetical protein
MGLTPVLGQIRAAGVKLTARAGMIHVDAPEGVMTPRRIAWLKRHKAELLELLHAEPESEPVAPASDGLIPWIDMPDVITVVEDLADEGKRPGQISRLLGLRRDEVVTILRRSGR